MGVTHCTVFSRIFFRKYTKNRKTYQFGAYQLGHDYGNLFSEIKNLFDTECGTSAGDDLVSRSDLNFTVASLSNVFYDDKYKIIMCAVPKAATSNWQRVLAVLKYDGKVDPSHFHHSYGDIIFIYSSGNIFTTKFFNTIFLSF